MSTATFRLRAVDLISSVYNEQRHIDDYSSEEAINIGPKAQKMCETAFVANNLGDVTGLVVAHKHFRLADGECLVTYKTSDMMQPLKNRVETITEDLLPVMFILRDLDDKIGVMPVLFVHEVDFPEVKGMLNRLEEQGQHILKCLKDEAQALAIPIDTLGVSLSIHPTQPDNGRNGFTLVEVTDEATRTQTFQFEMLKPTNPSKGALYSTTDDVPIPRMLPVIWKQIAGENRVGSCVTCGCCCLDS